MKNKIRSITVDGGVYMWGISHFNGDGDGGYGLKVWKDRKEIIDEWIDGYEQTPTTPKIVAEKIKKLLTNSAILPTID